MHIAILVVLIIIAVILAPWLIGVAIGLAALYGIWLVVAGAAGVVIFLGAVIYVGLTGAGVSKRQTCPSCQANLTENVAICPACNALL